MAEDGRVPPAPGSCRSGDAAEASSSPRDGDPSRGELRADMKAVIARALVNETQAGGGAFDDLADAVLDALAYEDVSLVRNYRAAGAQDCDTLAALHNRAATQLEIALAALIKIDRGAKGAREAAGMALLRVALVPYPSIGPASAMEAAEGGRDPSGLDPTDDSATAKPGRPTPSPIPNPIQPLRQENRRWTPPTSPTGSR